jgi:hypothetical protein
VPFTTIKAYCNGAPCPVFFPYEIEMPAIDKYGDDSIIDPD